MKRHMQTKHKSEYEAAIANIQEDEAAEKKIKFAITLGKNEVKDACIDLVTLEKLPLAIFDSECFKTLTSQIFSALDMPAVSSRNIMGMVEEKFNDIKNSIMASLKDKMLSLKMDTATRCNRGILCVNVQYIHDTGIAIRTLGLIELNMSHTSRNICSEIESLLSQFAIQKQQIYTITTDNGRNMVKAVELLNDTETADIDEDDEDEEELMLNTSIGSITSVRCAAHTLQLAVKDFLEDLEAADFICKARKLVKLLRTPTYRHLITEAALPQPVVDVATRWSSTYNMLSKLLGFETFCERHCKHSMKLTPTEWLDLKQLVEALEPAYLATLQFQSSQLFMSDFYKLWMELKLTPFLDPRLRRILLQHPENVMRAKTEIKQLLRQLWQLKEKIDTDEACSTSNLTETNLLSQNSQSCSLLTELLSSIEVDAEEEADDDGQQEILKGYAEIDSYSPKPISLDADIMQYWSEKQFQYPNLYQLAKVVLAVPATQALSKMGQWTSARPSKRNPYQEYSA
ncbi:uncharacterized protein LOC108102221 [Drosophila ficusphila]|uniref:uncharacterized protein LOC108102221 n=1 Tax=Drosophila ficusphila TaxID=30025 RepID=UPI001C8A1DFF|nr:uncharacterized protein LOC108102221 [Drosophila ficusphila]